MEHEGAKGREGTKREGTKREGTKREGTKREGTKREGTKHGARRDERGKGGKVVLLDSL